MGRGMRAGKKQKIGGGGGNMQQQLKQITNDKTYTHPNYCSDCRN
jgi:hypothetical protein